MVDAQVTAAPAQTPSGDGHATNPLRVGLPSDRIEDPCSIVFFGASGDLFKRMLLPAIYSMRLRGTLPTDFALIGFSRTPYTDETFRDYCREQLDAFMPAGQKPQGGLWDDFAKRISYVTAANFSDTQDYIKLKAMLEKNDRDFGTGGNHVFYLSTPPAIFPEVVKHLNEAGLEPAGNETGWTRIVVEKPFGIDLDSARALQTTIEKVFPERSIYRIDHYLGKEPVQDIIALRFANTIFEPIWNRNYVANVQITAAESLGVEERGGYYDGAGALRDMIQNHVLNLLALVAMEPPISAAADDIREEKYKVLSAISPPSHADVFEMSARGQYAAGSVNGAAVIGYRQEDHVAPDSNTETFAAVKFCINNWRWAGVPFYLRSGKRLPRKVSEIVVTFKPIPHRFYGESTDRIEPNLLVIKIQPEEGVAMRFEAKVPGPKDHVRSVYMDFNYGSGFGVQSPPAYERLIGDVIRGDQTLFTRWDAVQRAWELVMPVLDVWQHTKDFTFPNYDAGSQGPESARQLFPIGDNCRMSVDLRIVLDEMAERRRNRRDMNVATMTVVVFFNDAAVGEWARDRTHALAVKHPSRVIVLDGTQPATAFHVGATCEEHADCVKTRGDWVELGVDGYDPQTLLSAVSTLSLPEMPAVLIWVASGMGHDPRFSALVSRMRTVVYNSSVLDDGDAALRELATFVSSHQGASVTDLAYLRLAPWQESVALFFDGRNVLGELFGLRHVEITCGSDSEAYYLLGWLASRLEWKTCGPDRFCNRFGTEIDFRIVREGRARRIRRIALRSSGTDFVAQIDDENAEAIVLTVTGEKTHPERCRPINNIDIAALVERAILTGHNDRVFVESLLAAGEILDRRKGLSNV